MSSTPSWPGSVPTAMVCAGVVTAQFVAGKATRDALYLAHLSVTSLPVIVITSSAASMLLVLFSSRILRRVPPSAFVPTLFVSNALLLLAEWGLSSAAPTTAAVTVYLQIAGLGPMLGSGFWLITSEQFDPRTAKQRFGQIAGVGTLGGLIGGLIAERMAAVLPAPAMLPVLAAMSFAGAWQVRRLAGSASCGDVTAVEPAPDLSAAPVRSGLQVLGRAPYLRNACSCASYETWNQASAKTWWETYLPELTGPLSLNEAPSDARGPDRRRISRETRVSGTRSRGAPRRF